MARQESVAVAGYYPTPTSVLPLIAKLLRTSSNEESPLAFVDPCAGAGEALLEVVKSLRTDNATVYTVELEQSRHEALKANIGKALRCWQSRDVWALHGDAFKASWRLDEGASLLYLNPPYDTDPEHGRLEQKFLDRFAPTLTSKGVLVFLVPFYALKASASTLATMFDVMECYRFPEPEFAFYKQVALFARKRETDLLAPDPILQSRVLEWAGDADALPALTGEGNTWDVPALPRYTKPFSEWAIKDLDLQGLLSKVAPWSVTDRSGKPQAMEGFLPEAALEDLLVRRYPVAMPPRSAHIAAGIAAGVFNGSRITPDDPSSQLPPILVKGSFDKEFRTVEEKKDEDDNVKAVVQVQQPKLVTTVLDLQTSEYVTIKPLPNLTGASSLSEMTMGDFLAAYGRGLMRVMLQQCPVQHDPSRLEDQIELPTLARPLYEAQRQAVMGTIKLLGGLSATKRERRFKAAFVLGEIGSGKSSCALATAQAIGAKRTLIMCPPHLLTSWSDQIKAVTPWVRTLVLSDVGDVQQLAALQDDTPTIALLSRETAKLGHGYIGVSKCGSCGATPEAGDHVKKRSLCTGSRLEPRNALGRLVQSFGFDLLQAFPQDPRVTQVLNQEPLQAACKRWAEKKTSSPTYASEMWGRLVARGNLDRVVDDLLTKEDDGTLPILEKLLAADPRPELVLKVVQALYARPIEGYSYSDPDHLVRARHFLLLLPPEVVSEAVTSLQERDVERKKGQPSYYGNSDPWVAWHKRQAFLWSSGEDPHDWDTSAITHREGKFCFYKLEVGDRTLALDAFLTLVRGTHRTTPECGEPLYQAVAEPRRYPLATYICRKHPNLFDLLILDEGHEYKSENSAQGNSADRLVGLGIPTMILTGTVMNGYAESFFRLMWMSNPEFRMEFAKDECQRFVDRYGYRKRLVENKSKDTGKVVAYGSVTDRVERSEKIIGNAPGILPLFLLRYLLPLSVTLHKTDLSVNIPTCHQERVFVDPSPEQLRGYNRLRDALVAQVKHDRFEEGLAGKLFGQLAELPSYLDRAAYDYEIRYPESAGGGLVASQKGLGADSILPKEAWMLDCVEQELAAGRRVMVFSWHVELIPRLAKLIEDRIGEKVAVLHADKVPTAKREDWINREVVKKNRRVMVTNPVAIQTGLNNLVHFATEVWCENPAVNPLTYRQAIGRVDRIGQSLETRIFFPVYRNTLQESLYDLLMQKVAVSLSADGQDPQAAMAMAGIGEDNMTGLMVGQYIWSLLSESDQEAA